MANANDTAAIRAGVKVVTDRILRAADDFIALVADKGFSTEEAGKIFGAYLKTKAIKFEGHGYVVKHGGFWDREVLERALDWAKESA